MSSPDGAIYKKRKIFFFFFYGCCCLKWKVFIAGKSIFILASLSRRLIIILQVHVQFWHETWGLSQIDVLPRRTAAQCTLIILKNAVRSAQGQRASRLLKGRRGFDTRVGEPSTCRRLLRRVTELLTEWVSEWLLKMLLLFFLSSLHSTQQRALFTSKHTESAWVT